MNTGYFIGLKMYPLGNNNVFWRFNMISPLRQKRFFGELSIYDLSQKTGIHPPKISLIERGYVMPREDEKKRIARALGCKVTDIFPAEEATAIGK